MGEIAFSNSIGTWVRLVYNGVTVGLDRWPGDHQTGSAIHANGSGCFVFDHLDATATEGPEAVYIWTPTS
jgi:hypothetical protein